MRINISKVLVLLGSLVGMLLGELSVMTGILIIILALDITYEGIRFG